MQYIDEFRSQVLVKKLQDAISRLVDDKEVYLMEVCGTHTVSIFRHGIRQLLPPSVKLLSGPGCPVCVTPQQNIDYMLTVALMEDVIVTTFGDMMRVPGSSGCLQDVQAQGADVRVVYCAMDTLKIAQENPTKKIVFFAIGFETTSPTIAALLLVAKEKKIKNFFLYNCCKLIPPALGALLLSGKGKIDGFILPGHVSTIIGSKPYEFIPRYFGVSCVIAGFEPVDILQAIYMLLKQKKNNQPRVQVQYTRSVRDEGNPKALKLLYDVFAVCDSDWRGLGMIAGSGLRVRDEFLEFDVGSHFDVEVAISVEREGCLCGEILRGLKTPLDCPLFKRTCTTDTPQGPCMVSSEGTCAAYYKYHLA